MEMDKHLLGGITALDLSEGVSGPYCAKLLAGMGAEVIKVEAPGVGEASRREGPFFGDVPHPEGSALHLYLNTGKKSVTLDLDSERGADALLRLAESSDVLIESAAPGRMEGQGLGYDALAASNAGLVYVSITPFGQTGPYRDYLATDIVTQAIGALMHTVGLPDREPLKIGGSVVLYAVGTAAFSGAMLALYTRDFMGEGQHVDVSAMEAITVAQIHASIHHQFGRIPARRESALVRTTDGWVSPGLEIGVKEDIWAKVCDLMGVPELADDPAFSTREARREHQQDVLAIVGEWAAAQTKEDIYHTLQGMRTIAGYVADVEDLLDSGQLNARDFFQNIEHPHVGTATYPGEPIRVSGHAWRHERAPLLGEHNGEILGGRLGLSKAEIAETVDSDRRDHE